MNVESPPSNVGADQSNHCQEITQECIRYFRENPGLHRLLAAIREKYRSLGTLGGRVRLSNLKPEEKLALTGLLRRDYYRQPHAVIQVSAVVSALNDTKFQGVDFLEALIGYWGEELLSKKEELSIYYQQRDGYFRELASKLPAKAGNWLMETLVRKDNAYKTLITRYDQDPDSLTRDLEAVGTALAQLPSLFGERMQLPIFSSQLTADPHFFDRGMGARQLLIYALIHIFDCAKPGDAFDEVKLLYKAGLYSTEIANYTICCGLLGYLNNTDIHEGWRGFYENGESLQVSLENLSRLEKVTSPSGIALVVENPAVFSALAQRGTREFMSPLPLVCANGQVNLATFTLLEMLVSDGALLYYSGDFDPEGLLIADRLKKRFNENLRLWRYTPTDYANSLSDYKLSAGRLKQLKRLEDKTLIEVGTAMEDLKHAGYQEVLIEELWEDAQSLMLEPRV